MKHAETHNDPSRDAHHPLEIEFSILDGDLCCRKYLGEKNTGTVVNRDNSGIGMISPIPLQPGNIVKFDREGSPQLGIVMWSIESADKYRIQVRFLKL